MIVAIPYHNGDLPLMKRWANRVKQLGPYMNHEIIISPIRGASTEDIHKPLANCFRKVHVLPSTHKEEGWPVSCNRSFQNIAWYVMMQIKQPFLFMEPDASPLCEGWIDKIEDEYHAAKRPFMGDFVHLSSVIPDGMDHMSGVAVYDWNLAITAPRLFSCASSVKQKDGTFSEMEFAWDVFAASDIVPKMHITNLIHHDWTGTGDKPHEWRKWNVDPSFVESNAVIYHPDKRGVLLNDGLAGEGTRVEGEPRTGVGGASASFEQSFPVPTSQPNQEKIETIEIKKESPKSGTKESELAAIQKAIAVLAFHQKIGGWNKKQVKEGLIKAGFAKAQKVKRTGKKVRRTLVDA